jgi:hypothetical protein
MEEQDTLETENDKLTDTRIKPGDCEQIPGEAGGDKHISGQGQEQSVMHQLDSVHVYSFKDCSGP